MAGKLGNFRFGVKRPPEGPFASHRAAGERTIALVFALYVLCFFRVTQLAETWARSRLWKGLMPLWPVAWLKRVNHEAGVDVLFAAALAAGLWVCLRPLNRLARLVFATAYFQVVALSLSLAKISHSDHASLWVVFLLCLAPGGNLRDLGRARFRHAWLTVFAGCQWMVALFYSLAGLWKLVGFVRAPTGWVSLLDYGGLGYSIAVKAGQTGGVSAPGQWLAAHPFPATVASWLVLYVQLFSVVAVTRPKVHRLWGAGLVGFHLATLIGMDIPFLQTMPLLAILWIGSPFVPQGASWREAWAELPVVKLALNVVNRVRRALSEIQYPEKSGSSV